MLVIAAASAGFGRDLEECLTRIEALVEAAGRRGARLLVLPEAALGGYLRAGESGLDLPPELDPDGPEIARLIRMAGDMVVCAGFTERGMYASAVCVSGDGVHGLQRKVHLPPSERFAYSPGAGFEAFDTPVGRLGMLVCYDKLFPESARALALDGADIVCALSAWGGDATGREQRHFDLCDELRAVENQVVWVSANQSGGAFVGAAKVVDPDGAVLARTGAGEGLAIAGIDPRQAVADTRARIDHLGDRRPETYGALPGAASSFVG